MKKKYDQELQDVIAEFPKFNHQRWKEVQQLIEDSKFLPLNKEFVPGYKIRTTTEEGKLKWDPIFPQDAWECPLLASEFLPFNDPPSILQVKVKLKEEIKTQKFRFVPPMRSSEEELEAATRLIDSIPSQDQVSLSPLVREGNFAMPGSDTPAKGSSVSFESPAFAKYYDKKLTIDTTKGLLKHTNPTDPQVTVMSHGSYFETEFNQHYTVSVLLAGKMLWITFPQNTENLAVLKKAYKGLNAKDDEESQKQWRNVLEDMGYGITFVQQAGETVVIPPLWPHMVMSIDTSLDTRIYVAKSIFVPLRVQYIDLWAEANMLWPTPEDEQEHVVAYAQQLTEHFVEYMEAEIEAEDKVNKTAATLCRHWSVTRKSVIRLLVSIQDPEKINELNDKFQQAWIDYLVHKAQATGQCSICHQELSTMSRPDRRTGVDEAYILSTKIERHFEKRHWT